jgi:imidazolonepropionase-like amidohydrolase
MRMLTMAPAAKFNAAAATGTIEVGKAGDLTVLDGDPIDNAKGFASVRYTAAPRSSVRQLKWVLLAKPYIEV